MASPVVEATAKSSTSTAGTSHTVTLPAGIVGSDLVLIVMDIGSTSATLNALTDWGEILDENSANGLKILWYTGAGVPSNPTFTSSASTRDASISYRISGANKSITPEIGTTGTGTSATPDPPASATPGSTKDYLFIAIAGMAGEEADDDTWGNTPPTNYLPNPPLQSACGVAGTNLGGLILAASRQLTTGSAEDPGTFGVDVSAAWRSQTIMVHPAPINPVVSQAFPKNIPSQKTAWTTAVSSMIFVNLALTLLAPAPSATDIFPAPLYARPGYTVRAQDTTQLNLQTNTLAPVSQDPFKPPILPNPKIAKYQPRFDHPNLQESTLVPVVAANPFKPPILPNPKIARYTQKQILITIYREIAPDLPYNQYDWPNPVIRPYRAPIGRDQNNLSNLIIPNTKPNKQDQWPNPVLRKHLNQRQDYSSLNSIMLGAGVAPGSNDVFPGPLYARPQWRKPTQVQNIPNVLILGIPAPPTPDLDIFRHLQTTKIIPPARIQVQNIPNVLVTGIPDAPPAPDVDIFRQLQTTKIITRRPTQVDLPPNLALTPTYIERVPVQGSVIRGPRRNPQFDHINTIALVTIPNLKPAKQDDWPNPIRRAYRAPQDGIPDQIPTITFVNTQPFAQTAWPNPVLRTYAQPVDEIPNTIEYQPFVPPGPPEHRPPDPWKPPHGGKYKKKKPQIAPWERDPETVRASLMAVVEAAKQRAIEAQDEEDLLIIMKFLEENDL